MFAASEATFLVKSLVGESQHRVSCRASAAGSTNGPL